MTKILGLTGGIGAGKTTVSTLFEYFGAAVFNSDLEAKKAYQNEQVLSQVKTNFPEAFIGGTLHFQALADIVFNEPKQLSILNGIVHPHVSKLFREWCAKHRDRSLLVKEAAILFESGAAEKCDVNVVVAASQEIRMKRVMDRDGVSEEEVLQRMKRQWSEQQRIEKADFVIKNDGNLLIPQVLECLSFVS